MPMARSARPGPRPGYRQVLHRQDQADRRQKRECRADDRPGARLDEMKTRPVRNRRVGRVGHCHLPLVVIRPARRDRPNAPAPAARRRCEQRVGERDRIDPRHRRVSLELRIEEEHHRPFGALVRPEMLLGEAEARDLVEPSAGNFRRHVEDGAAPRLGVSLQVADAEKDGRGLARAHADRLDLRLEAPVEAGRDIGVEGDPQNPMALAHPCWRSPAAACPRSRSRGRTRSRTAPRRR